ncbi:acyl carrier protein [bacterium]|nr:acyl carrier protein [bacterium]
MTIFEKVREVVSEKLGVDRSRVVEEAVFTTDLAADSLDIVEFSMEMEDEFGITISLEELTKLTTVGDAVKYIEAHIRGNKCSCGGFIDAGMMFCPKCGREVKVNEDNFIDRGDYIELKEPIGNIRMIEKVCSPHEMNWYEAIQYAENLRKGGFTDWRVPTKDELLEIYKIKDICGIHKDEGWFWSSSTLSDDADYAWFVYFGNGYVSYSNKTSSNDVRCVR